MNHYFCNRDFFIIALLFIASCTSEKINSTLTENNLQEFELIDNRIKFKDHESYSLFLQVNKDDFHIDGFKSLLSSNDYFDPFSLHYQKDASKSQITASKKWDLSKPTGSPTFLSLLNNKGIIQIGDKVLRFTPYYHFVTTQEYAFLLEDNEYLQTLIVMNSKSKENIQRTASEDPFISVHTVIFSEDENPCIDYSLQEPCDSEWESPSPSPINNIVIDESEIPVNSGDYIKFGEDRKARLIVQWNGTKYHINIKPIINDFKERKLRAGIFPKWVSNNANILYADLHDISIIKKQNNSIIDFVKPQNASYLNFEDIGNFGKINSDHFIPEYISIPLNPISNYEYILDFIKTVNYIEEDKGKIYKIKRIAKTTGRYTLD